MTNNERLKEMMFHNKIPQRMVADKLGVSDMTVYRKLSRPMPEELYKTYLKAIEEIIEEK